MSRLVLLLLAGLIAPPFEPVGVPVLIAIPSGQGVRTVYAIDRNSSRTIAGSEIRFYINVTGGTRLRNGTSRVPKPGWEYRNLTDIHARHLYRTNGTAWIDIRLVKPKPASQPASIPVGEPRRVKRLRAIGSAIAALLAGLPAGMLLKAYRVRRSRKKFLERMTGIENAGQVIPGLYPATKTGSDTGSSSGSSPAS